MNLTVNAWSANFCTGCKAETLHHRGKCSRCGTPLSVLSPRLWDIDRASEPMREHRKAGGQKSKLNPRRSPV